MFTFQKAIVLGKNENGLCEMELTLDLDKTLVKYSFTF